MTRPTIRALKLVLIFVVIIDFTGALKEAEKLLQLSLAISRLTKETLGTTYDIIIKLGTLYLGVGGLTDSRALDLFEASTPVARELGLGMLDRAEMVNISTISGLKAADFYDVEYQMHKSDARCR